MVIASSIPIDVLEKICTILEKKIGLKYAFLPSTPEEEVIKSIILTKMELWKEQKNLSKNTKKSFTNYSITLEDLKLMSNKEKEQVKYYIKNSTIYYDSLVGELIHKIIPFCPEIRIGIPVTNDEKVMSNVFAFLESI
jgi:hypothetical protein